MYGGIDPGLRDDARAVARTDLGLVGVDDRVERRPIDQAFLDEQRFERLDPQRQVGRDCLVFVVIGFRHRDFPHAAYCDPRCSRNL